MSSTILIVEDNLVNQKLMQAIVRSAGHQSVVVNNGREAVDILRVKIFDLVLLDLMMPIMDGFEAARVIRKDLKLMDLPIIAVTANTLVGSRERALQSGCNAYLAKPYTKHQLLSMINDWLRGSSDQFYPAGT